MSSQPQSYATPSKTETLKDKDKGNHAEQEIPLIDQRTDFKVWNPPAKASSITPRGDTWTLLYVVEMII